MPDRFAIYAENWPVDERRASTGLDRAIIPIAAALSPLQPKFLLAPRRFTTSLFALHPAVLPFAHFAPLRVRLFNELGKRLFGTNGRMAAPDAHLGTLLLELKNAVLLSILGGDPAAYIRAGQLARQAGMAHVIYALDDPFEWENSAGVVSAADTRMRPELVHTFQEACSLLAITPALARRLTQRLDRQCEDLPLPACEASTARTRVKNQIIYVGNLNYLYSAGFYDVVSVVRALRAEGHDTALRATVPQDDVARVLGEVPGWVVCGRIDERTKYINEICESVAAICPISPNLPELATTSFPSKLIDYMAHARCIVVYGPNGCTAVDYFEANGLDFVATNCDVLREVLQNIATVKPDRSASYRTVLAANHGSNSFRAKIESILARYNSQ